MTSLSIKTCCFVGVHHRHHGVSALALNNTFVLLVATVKAAFTLADSIFLSVILCFMLLKKSKTAVIILPRKQNVLRGTRKLIFCRVILK